MSAKDYEIVLCKDGNLYINKKDGESTRSTDSKKLSEDDIAEIAKFFKKKEPVSENLEKEIQRYYVDWNEHPEYVQTARHFANWQKEQDKQWLAENHKHIFAKGYDEGVDAGRKLGKAVMKQQMMKNAIDGVVLISNYNQYATVEAELYQYSQYENLEKVKLIIIKED